MLTRIGASAPVPDREAGTEHLGESSLLAFVSGAASAESEQHVDTCEECREVVVALLRQPEALPPVLPKAGDRFAGRFLIRALLGSGAAGTVVAADDEVVGGRVALKILAPSLCDDARVLATVLREVNVSRRLRHQNVRQVFDVQQHERLTFLVMELIDGATLEAHAGGRLLDVHEVHGILLQIAAGLAAAHSAGIVHRDVKPSNVLIDREGRVLVTDFGLARAMGPAASLMHASGIVGTPLFWSPEQSRGEPATAASDVYSFGLVAHWLLTGATYSLNEPVLAPATYRRVINRCLELKPAARYVDAKAVLAALSRCRGRSSVRGAAFATGVGVAALCAAIVPQVVATNGSAAAFRGPSPTETPRAERPKAEGESSVAPAPHAAAPSVSVDDLPSVVSVLPTTRPSSRLRRKPEAAAAPARAAAAVEIVTAPAAPRSGPPDIDRDSPYRR